MKDSRFVAAARRKLLRRGRILVRSGASRSESGDVFDALSQAEQAELAQIHHALERIERGIFGRCESCSQEMDDHRLAASPWEPRCTQCDDAPMSIGAGEQLSA